MRYEHFSDSLRANYIPKHAFAAHLPRKQHHLPLQAPRSEGRHSGHGWRGRRRSRVGQGRGGSHRQRGAPRPRTGASHPAPPAPSRPAAAAPPRARDQLRARHVGACRRSRRPQWSCRRTRRAAGGCWATPAVSPAARLPPSSVPPSAASWITRRPGWVRRGRGGAGRAAPLRGARGGTRGSVRPRGCARVSALERTVPTHTRGEAPARGRLQSAAARGVIANARRLH